MQESLKIFKVTVQTNEIVVEIDRPRSVLSFDNLIFNCLKLSFSTIFQLEVRERTKGTVWPHV